MISVNPELKVNSNDLIPQRNTIFTNRIQVAIKNNKDITDPVQNNALRKVLEDAKTQFVRQARQKINFYDTHSGS